MIPLDLTDTELFPVLAMVLPPPPESLGKDGPELEEPDLELFIPIDNSCILPTDPIIIIAFVQKDFRRCTNQIRLVAYQFHFLVLY